MIAPSANVAESLPDVVYCGTYNAEETVATPTDTESKVGVEDAVIVAAAPEAVAVILSPTKLTDTTVPAVPTVLPSSLIVIPEITDPPPTPVSPVPSPINAFAVIIPDTFMF